MKWLAAILLSIVYINANGEPVNWPPLPTKGYIVGRAATQADVKAGRAVFVAGQGHTVIGKPLPLKIPQYAWLKQDQTKIPVIIVQAEEANGFRLVGARYLNGEDVIGGANDFELLGTKAPR